MNSEIFKREDIAIYFTPSEKTLSLWLQILYDKSSSVDKKILKSLLEKAIEVLDNFSVIYSNTKNQSILKEVGSLIGYENFIDKIQYLNHKNMVINILQIFEQREIKHVLYYDSLYPFFDCEVTERLLVYADQYYPDYSFVENIPSGIVPDIFSDSLIETLDNQYKELKESDENFDLISFLRKNLNDFHVEIHYESPDLRMLRLDVALKTKRSILETNNIIKKIDLNQMPYAQLQDIIKNSPEVIYTHPSYLEVELISDCDYHCTFCPRQFAPIEDASLSMDMILKIKEYLSESLDDVTVTFGGMGEPLLHPKIIDYIEKIISEKSLQRIIVETSGFHLNKILLDIEKISHPEKLFWIINFNSIENYQDIHGVPDGTQKKVVENIDHLIQIYRKNGWSLSSIYMQMLKIEENESEIDAIYALTQEKGISFLLQKYNTYNTLMPQKRVSDMTPLQRSFCWHLRRDLFIRSNGNVSYCKQDAAGNLFIGNLKEKSILEIFKSRVQDFVKNYQGNLAESPNCSHCDEYFTFNF